MDSIDLKLKLLAIYVPITSKYGIANGEVLEIVRTAYNYVVEAPIKIIAETPVINTTTPVIKPIISRKRKK